MDCSIYKRNKKKFLEYFKVFKTKSKKYLKKIKEIIFYIILKKLVILHTD